MAVQRHGRFQPERVARAQPARLNAELPARFQNGGSTSFSLGRGIHVNFETILARVAGTRNARRHAAHLAIANR